MQSAKQYYTRMYREIRTTGKSVYPLGVDKIADSAFWSWADSRLGDRLRHKRGERNHNVDTFNDIRRYLKYFYPKTPFSTQPKPVSIWDVLPLA